MKNYLVGVKYRLETNYYEKDRVILIADLMNLKRFIDMCKQKNLKQEMCNYYNELFMLRERMCK